MKLGEDLLMTIVEQSACGSEDRGGGDIDACLNPSLMTILYRQKEEYFQLIDDISAESDDMNDMTFRPNVAVNILKCPIHKVLAGNDVIFVDSAAISIIRTLRKS